MIQDVPEPIFPKTIDGWLGLFLQSVAIFSVVSAVFHKVVVVPILKTQTELQANYASNAQSIADLSKKTQASEFDRAQIHQNVGRLEGIMERNESALTQLREIRHADQVEIVERLARIEANVNVAAAMDRLGEKIVGAIADRGRLAGGSK